MPRLTYTTNSLKRARHLRHESTNQEKKLWRLIRNKQLGVVFRRQAPIGRYIVDFVALGPKLVVEVDGIQHQTPEIAARDRVRTMYLMQRGFSVLRVTNREVMFEFERVLARIKRAATSPRPSPQRGGSVLRQSTPPLLPGEGRGEVLSPAPVPPTRNP